MSEITDLLLSVTDPVVALMLLGLGGYIRRVRASLHADVERVRHRVERMESVWIQPDGGQAPGDRRED